MHCPPEVLLEATDLSYRATCPNLDDDDDDDCGMKNRKVGPVLK
jgi:hypothetical protein